MTLNLLRCQANIGHRFWSVQFSLSIRSSKVPKEVIHTKLDPLYFVKEMFNGKEIRHTIYSTYTVTVQGMEEIIGVVVGKIDVSA